MLVSVRGSHHKFFHSDLKRMVVVPHPRKDIPTGTVLSIYEVGRRTEARP